MRYLILVVLAASVVCVTGCGGGGGPPAGYSVDSNKWVTTPSGLRRKDFELGVGAKAKQGDAVNVSYTGWLESLSEANPFVEDTTGLFIGEDSVVGLEEGLLGMRMGGTCELIIPPALAYGEEGREGVPPNAIVHFRVTMNSVDTGYVTRPNELQYQYIEFGEGQKAVDGQSLTVNYEGSLVDGTVFDSSLQEGREPYTFVLGTGNVIQGWHEGLRGVRQGATINLIIPPSLGYGDQQHSSIPPNSTLYFRVEVISID